MPTTAQIRRWRLRFANGWSIRRIASAETKPMVSHSTVHRALHMPVTVDQRRKPRVDPARVALCRAISVRVAALDPPSAKRLGNVHLDMYASDVTAILRETRRDVLKALGFPIG